MDKMSYAKDLSELIKIRTVTDCGDEIFLKFRQTLEAQLPALHKVCDRIITKNNALLFKWKGKSDKKPLVLMGHQDVVPADDSGWKYPPFGGVIADGRIWGRGAMDCKNTLYACLKSVDELIAENYTPEHDVYIACSDCEETFGDGAPSIVDYMERNGIKPFVVLDEGGAILPEPFPGITKPYAMIGVLEKGFADIKFTARSKGGHSSSPPKNTPVARLAKFIAEVEDGNFLKKKMVPEVEEMLTELSKSMKGALKFLLGNLKIFKPIVTKVLPKASPFGNALLSTTCVFTMTKASDASNVIPQEAYAVANLRLIPHQGLAECASILTAIAKKYDIETEVLTGHDALPPVSTESAGYKMLIDTIKKVFPPIGTAPYVIMGGTDCRHFQRICDCAIRFTPMTYYPDQMAGMHGVDESVDIDTLADGIAFMKEFIRANK